MIHDAMMQTALENGDNETANEVHLKLILDYPSEVSQWMVGIKRLIQELAKIDKAKSNDGTQIEMLTSTQIFNPLLVCNTTEKNYTEPTTNINTI